MAGTGLTFNSIAANVPTTLKTYEDQIKALTDADNGNLTSGDLFTLQQLTTQWSLAATTYTTILKSLGDTMRGALQKIN